MKRLVFVGSILGTIAVLLAACFFVLATLAWLIRSWYPTPWVVAAAGVGMIAVVVALLWRWWRLPTERRFRFSLRGMLVAITLFALWFGLIGIDVLRWGKEGAAVMELAGRGVTVTHYLRVDQDWAKTRELLARVFGYNPFLRVQDIDIRRNQGLLALLEHSNDLHDLEHVNFWWGGISDAGLERVGELDRFPMLRSGLLYGCNVTDSGLERLAGWRRLEMLYLHNCGKITDRGLAHLHKLPNLEYLRLLQEGTGKMPITDVGMAHVACLDQLKELHMVRVPISDAGIAQLRNMPNLQRVHLGETKVTEKGVRALCETLPDCFVTWDKASCPAVSQIRQIEIWSKRPPQRQLATITEIERIEAIKKWIDQAMLLPGGGWQNEREDGPADNSLSVRFEGRRRRLCEIGLGNGTYLTTSGSYRLMLPADDEEIRTLLGVDATQWATN